MEQAIRGVNQAMGAQGGGQGPQSLSLPKPSQPGMFLPTHRFRGDPDP